MGILELLFPPTSEPVPPKSKRLSLGLISRELTRPGRPPFHNLSFCESQSSLILERLPVIVAAEHATVAILGEKNGLAREPGNAARAAFARHR
jgi:hypothetical protein